MRQVLLSILLVSFFSFFACAQEDNEAPLESKLAIRDVYFSAGAMIQLNRQVSLQDFYKLAPHSQLLNTYFVPFDKSGPYNFNTGMVLNAAAGVHFADKRKAYYKPNPQLRVGISFFSGSYLSYYLDQQTRVPFDTVPSNVPGQPYIIDSVYAQEYYLSYNNEQVRLNASLLYRTSRMKRWSFYGGAGFSLGYTTASTTDILYDYATYIKVERNKNGHYSVPEQRKDTFFYESFRTPASLGYSLYIPAGIDFRIGKRSAFLRRIHLYTEVWSGVNAVLVNRFRFIHEFAYMNIWGLRFTID